MFIRLSTYLYGCRFCWDALDSAKKSRWHYGPSKLITAALAERIQTTPILYSVHDELCYVYIYIYVPTCVFFASFSHPSFVFLHIWCPCEISPSSFCLWPLANLTSCSSWWTIWAGPTWASTGILPFPSPL